MNELKNIWKLKFKNKVYGFRVHIGNSFYDIYVDDFSEKVKNKLISSRVIKSIPLIEHGNMLLTEQELKGLVIQELDSNLLHVLDDYLSSADLSDIGVDIKKKKERLSNKFIHYVPAKYIDDFVDFHIKHFDRNDNMYETLSKEQKEVIKGYMRFRSKKLFKELTGKTKLSVNRMTKLYQLKGDVDDWVYDGVEDTGYFGGGVCTLGHTLRYEHYAYSKTLNERIIFGTKCMSDFFDTNESTIRALTSLQERLIDELKVTVYLKEKGLSLYDLDKNEFWEVLKSLKGSFDKAMDGGSIWVTILSKWVNSGLPLTKKLYEVFTIFKRFYQEVEKDKLVNKYLGVLEGSYGYRLYRMVLDGGEDNKFSQSLGKSDYISFFNQSIEKLSVIDKCIKDYGVTREDVRRIVNIPCRYVLENGVYECNREGDITKTFLGEEAYKLKLVYGLLLRYDINLSLDFLDNFKHRHFKKMFETAVNWVYNERDWLFPLLKEVKEKGLDVAYDNEIRVKRYWLNVGIIDDTSHLFFDVYGYLAYKGYIEKKLHEVEFALKVSDSINANRKISIKQADVINQVLRNLTK